MVSRATVGARVAQTGVGLQTQGPLTRWRHTTDAVLVTLVFVASVFLVEGANGDLVLRPAGDLPLAAYLIFAVGSGAIVSRRSHPLVVLAVTVTATELAGILNYSEVLGISFLIALFSVGRYTIDRWSYAAVGVSLAFVVTTGFFVDRPPLAEVGFGALVVFGVWYLGRRIRFRGERRAQLERERAAEAGRMTQQRRGGRRHRVLILTTFDPDEYVYEALRAGASGFVLKDIPPEDLVAAVRTVAEGGALLAPSITRRLIGQFADRLAVDTKVADRLDRLTDREREVLGAIAHGSSNAEISEELFIGAATVKSHVSSILTKLGLRDRAQAVVFAYESGLARPGDYDIGH